MKIFRLDRIEKQPVILSETAVLKPEDYSIAEYSKYVFRMFDADQPTEVKLLCKTSIIKAMIDNLGMDVNTVPVEEDHFTAGVSVCTSPSYCKNKRVERDNRCQSH